ncbi:MAG: hypothetical protein IK048_01765 [Clostridia bacterium]|nr:hypothetical protein [Clostridia bacterium]
MIKLINPSLLSQHGLPTDSHGIIVNTNGDTTDAMFFNKKNVGDYIVLTIHSSDFVVEKEKLPKNIQKELCDHLNQIKQNAKMQFAPQTIKEYDQVELLVEKEKYAKFGVHKGAHGYAMDSNAVQNNIIVDFSYVNEKGDYFGDCITVNIKDLKVIKTN